MKIFLLTLMGVCLLSLSPNEAFAKKKNKGTPVCAGTNCNLDENMNDPCCGN